MVLKRNITKFSSSSAIYDLLNETGHATCWSLYNLVLCGLRKWIRVYIFYSVNVEKYPQNMIHRSFLVSSTYLNCPFQIEDPGGVARPRSYENRRPCRPQLSPLNGNIKRNESWEARQTDSKNINKRKTRRRRSLARIAVTRRTRKTTRMSHALTAWAASLIEEGNCILPCYQANERISHRAPPKLTVPED